MEEPSVAVVIVAGGKGTRMGGAQNKLLLPLGNSTILGQTVALWQKISLVQTMIIVCGAGETRQVAEICRQQQITKLEQIVIGGKERQDSVWQGLQYLANSEKKPTYVVIHDGARPFYIGSEFCPFYQAVRKSQVAGGILAVPVQDTIKTVCGQWVEQTLRRENLVAVQTPQLFDFSVLYDCYQKNLATGVICTDDAGMLEAQGKAVLIFPGQKTNIKITTPEDYAYGQFLWQKRQEGALENGALKTE